MPNKSGTSNPSADQEAYDAKDYWNSSNMDKNSWLLRRLEKAAKNHDFVSLSETGTVQVKDRTVCVDKTHAADVAEENFEIGTLLKPHLRGLAEYQAPPLVFPATPAGAPAAAPAAAPPTPSTPKERLEALDVLEAFSNNPKKIKTVDKDYLEFFCAFMQSKTQAKYYRDKSKESGRLFVILFLAELDRDEEVEGTAEAILVRLLNTIEIGPTSFDLYGWNLLLDDITDDNEVLPEGLHITDPVMAGKLNL